MEIDFATNRLAAAGLSLSEASRLLAILRAVEKFEQLYGHRSLRLHALKGDRAGQYAVALTANYRLIIEKVSQDAVRILDVEDYHGD